MKLNPGVSSLSSLSEPNASVIMHYVNVNVKKAATRIGVVTRGVAGGSPCYATVFCRESARDREELDTVPRMVKWVTSRGSLVDSQFANEVILLFTS